MRACIRPALIAIFGDGDEECEALVPFGPVMKLEDVVEACGNARRAETRCLEKERLEKIAERQSEREERRRRAGVRHLARKWHAKLATAQAV